MQHQWIRTGVYLEADRLRPPKVGKEICLLQSQLKDFGAPFGLFIGVVNRYDVNFLDQPTSTSQSHFLDCRALCYSSKQSGTNTTGHLLSEVVWDLTNCLFSIKVMLPWTRSIFYARSGERIRSYQAAICSWPLHHLDKMLNPSNLLAQLCPKFNLTPLVRPRSLFNVSLGPHMFPLAHRPLLFKARETVF